MALVLKSKITSVIDSFKLYDLTGIYEASLNPGGYGAPNIAIASVVSAEVEVKFPDGTTQTINIFDGTPPISSLPSNGLTTFFEITPDLFSLDAFEMGYYEFTYTIISLESEVESTYTSKVCYFYYAPVECCINKKVDSIELCSNPQEIQEIMTVRGLFIGMQANAKIGNRKEALSILNYLKTKCDCCC